MISSLMELFAMAYEVTLTFTDLNHLKNMIVAIKNTISIMSEIEELGEGYLEGLR